MKLPVNVHIPSHPLVMIAVGSALVGAGYYRLLTGVTLSLPPEVIQNLRAS